MAIADQVFGYFMPVVNLMGPGAVKDVGNQAAGLGLKKALIVTDKGMKAMGIADQVKDIIEAAGVKAVIFAGAQPNPTDKNVADGLEMFKKDGCDLLVSLGGGSSHDCAKGIGLLAGNGGEIKDFAGVNKSTKPMTALIAINTTAGTASEMTRFCIITNSETHVKMAIVDWRCTPTVSINDPILMMGMPPALTAATGMDALTHSVEAYMSTIATPVTDSAALMSMKLIGDNLRQAVANGQNFEARNNMAYAQFLGGMAFNNASLGYVHAMAHQLGGFYDLPHGVCNAILLPHVERYNLNANPKRLGDIAVALGENIEGLSVRDAAEKGLDAIVKLSQDVGIPSGLAEIGAKEKDFELMAKNAMNDACAGTNPATVKLADVVQIFKNAM